MKTFQDLYRLIILFGLTLGAFSVLISKANASVVMLASPDITETTLSAADVENIYLGKRRTLPNGQNVKFVVLKAGDAHETFMSTYVKRSGSQFSAFWKRKIVDGTGIPPKSIDSDAEMVAFLKSNPGHIGYVAEGTATNGLQVITLQ
jgi:ABC-type phosphate transport system substrate-binding protein